jgi:signal transduction histidine kinase
MPMPSLDPHLEGFLLTGRWNMPARDPAATDVSESTELQRLTEALLLAERDRQLLGYEIHDGVVQDLTAAAMYLEGAGREAQFASVETREKFASGLRLLRDAIAEMRRLIRGAQTVELDERGLIATLQRLAEKFRADHALPVEFSARADGLMLPASTQHLLLRIAQEAFNNIWKHARANRVQIELAVSGNQLELRISDDGLGFDPAFIPAGHIGLEGMRTRARILGADLQIDSRAGQGTRVTVTMPLQK